MAGNVRTDVQVTGLRELQKALRDMVGPGYQPEVERIARPAAKATLAKSIAAEAPVGRPSEGHNYRDPSAARKPLDTKHLRDTVTVRKLRRRPGELFAFGVGPRGFTKWWVIRGTKPHVIRAKSGKSLLIGGGHPVHEVQHPGARGNDFVTRGSRGRGEAAAAREMQKSWDRYVARQMRKARQGGSR